MPNLEYRCCSRCGVYFSATGEWDQLIGRSPRDGSGLHWWVLADFCPQCDGFNVWVGILPDPNGNQKPTRDIAEAPPDRVAVVPAYPAITQGANDPKRAPTEVQPEFAKDYEESCAILELSPNASAALSRRCLQRILREKAGVSHGTLYSEIQAAMKANTFPSHIAELLDVPRKVGNVAAHPTKNTTTEAIMDVEPWEATWCLEIIEALFDHYFVAPAKNAERLTRLEQRMRGGADPTDPPTQ